MKFKCFFILPFLMTLFMSTHISGYFTQDSYPIKIYLAPNQVYVLPEGIFYEDPKGNVSETFGLFTDQGGVYVVEGYYRCPACQKWNYGNICLNNRCSLFKK